tara:strand:- start:183 stop:380 length:198 start_codon:yes stop_codon:yes gene_type:complete
MRKLTLYVELPDAQLCEITSDMFDELVSEQLMAGDADCVAGLAPEDYSAIGKEIVDDICAILRNQ